MIGKKISIIVPAYNIENYLSRCLDSLLNQTYSNLEIIVVDDGSTDGTAKILDKYAKKDNRIIAIHQKNQGVSAARNYALDIATGEYIGFTDGDDVVESDMYELLVNIIEQKKVEIAHCGYQMVFPNRIDYYYNTGKEYYFDHEEGLYQLLSGKMVEPGLWNKLYRSELFKDVRLPNGIAETEDLLCNFELFCKAKDSYFVDLAKYHYMIRQGSATTTPLSEKKRRDRLYVVETMYKRTRGIEKLSAIAYEKYLRVLLENLQQKEWQILSLEAKKVLKNEMPGILVNIKLSLKIRLMILGAVCMPKLYRMIKTYYIKKTGIDKKYQI